MLRALIATYPRVWRAGPARDLWVMSPTIFPPIWSCSVWGLPCLRLYSRSGALLPHLFTLTLRLRAGRYFLCGTCRPGALTLRSRTLSGTLPCGVRTFLPRRTLRFDRQRSPSRLPSPSYAARKDGTPGIPAACGIGVRRMRYLPRELPQCFARHSATEVIVLGSLPEIRLDFRHV